MFLLRSCILNTVIKLIRQLFHISLGNFVSQLLSFGWLYSCLSIFQVLSLALKKQVFLFGRFFVKSKKAIINSLGELSLRSSNFKFLNNLHRFD
jgi:hypothetical protein